jgi:hypothetical protein
MSYQNERDQFIVHATRAGLSLDQTRGLLRHASTLQRLAVAQCNGDYPADNGERKVSECPICASLWVPATIKAAGCPDCRAARRVRAVLEGSPLEPEFHGDPRGAVLRLYLSTTPQADRGSGRERGIYVPARER